MVEAQLFSFRRALIATSFAIAVVAVFMSSYLERATGDYVASFGSTGRLATATTASPGRIVVGPRPGVDMMPTGSISRSAPPEASKFKNVIVDPAAGMPQ